MNNYQRILAGMAFFGASILHGMDEQIIRAAETGDIDRLAELKSRGANIAQAVDSEYGASPLMHAIGAKQFKAVQWLVNEARVLVNKANAYGTTPLMFACMCQGDNREVIEFLLSQPGIEIDAKNDCGSTAMYFAKKRVDGSYTTLLMNYRKQNISKENSPSTEHQESTFSKLLAAVRENKIGVIQDYVRSRPANFNFGEDLICVPLALLAAEIGEKEIIALLLESGLPYNKCSPRLCERAEEHGHKQLALYIKQHQELFSAVEKDDVKKLSNLLAQGLFADVRRERKEYSSNYDREITITETVLHAAARKGAENCVELLIKKGVSLNSTTSKDETALRIAFDQGHVNTTDILEAAIKAEQAKRA